MDHFQRSAEHAGERIDRHLRAQLGGRQFAVPGVVIHDEEAAGTWTVCVGDSSRGPIGTLVEAEITYKAM